jgi:hypothetical protein
MPASRRGRSLVTVPHLHLLGNSEVERLYRLTTILTPVVVVK